MASSQPGPVLSGLLVLVGGTVGSEKVCPDHTEAADGRGRGASCRHGSSAVAATRAVSRLRRRAAVYVERQGAPVETVWTEADH